MRRSLVQKITRAQLFGPRFLEDFLCYAKVNVAPITQRNVSENVCVKMACLAQLPQKICGEKYLTKLNRRKSP